MPLAHQLSTVPSHVSTIQQNVWDIISFKKKFIRICRQLLKLSAKCVEFPISHDGKNSFKKFLYPDPHPDNFQNLIMTSLSKDTAPVKLSWRTDQLSSCEVVTNSQTNRQTPGKCLSLAEVYNAALSVDWNLKVFCDAQMCQILSQIFKLGRWHSLELDAPVTSSRHLWRYCMSSPRLSATLF